MKYTAAIAQAFVGCVLLGSAAAFGQPTLEDLLRRIDGHPELVIRRAALEAAEARIPIRASLMEPKLILGVQNVPTSLRFREDPMTAKVVGLEQMLPYPGKLSTERTIGKYDVAIAQTRFNEIKNRLHRDVKVAWYEILHRQRAIDVNLRHARLIVDFKKELAVNVAYGRSSLSQLDQLDLEQTELRQMIAEDSAMMAMHVARLEYATGMRDLDIHGEDLAAIQSLAPDLDALMKGALESNPRLKQMQAEIEQATVSIERAKLEQYPDLDVMLMYMQRDDLPAGGHGLPNTPQMDMFSAQVSITLPFIDYGGARSAMVAEMEAMRAMKIAEQAQMQREIRMMLSERLARLAEVRRKYELYNSSILPSIENRIRLFITEYQFDKASLQTTITQIIALLHKEHEVLELKAEYQKTLAEIEYLIGSNLQ
jgi:outer membrane protein TolC